VKKKNDGKWKELKSVSGNVKIQIFTDEIRPPNRLFRQLRY
jgi:hypothetical protein